MSPAANYFKIRSATIIDSLLARWHRPARRRSAVQDDQLAFIDLALARNALTFGQFTLKSGRESPYFFNAGLFSDGEAAAILGRCYAAALVRSGIAFDMLFGPAYKGNALATSTAISLAAAHQLHVPYSL